MRTTLTIDDAIMQKLKEEAHRSGRSMKSVVNMALEIGLRNLDRNPRQKKYHLKTYSMGRPQAVSLDKALQIAAALEDEEIVRKMEVRK
jgi:hypothetical protein